MELEITSLRVYVVERVWNGRSYDFNVFNTWASAYAYVYRQMWMDGTEPAPTESGEYEISAEDTTAHPDHYEIYGRDIREYQFGKAEQEKARQRRLARLKRERS
jgi:hypothetical protein